MARSVKFYRDVLGFRPRFESEFWTEFDTDGTVLALHGGAKPNPAPAGARGEKLAGTVAIGLSVSNLAGTVRMLEGQGVAILMPPTLREPEGIRLAVFADPDGLPISLSERVDGTTGS
jgi:catechol 2,3-dioxygenase-like lactoylglutathione lyase family enzyme